MRITPRHLLRRDLLRGVLALGAGALVAGPSLATPFNDARRLSMANLHTGETFDAAYWEAGAYVPDALAGVNHLLRDFRTGDIHPMEPGLLDLIVAIADWVGAPPKFEIISGFRSAATNAMLHAESPQVAAHSLHMDGKAIDLRLQGVPLTAVRDAALSLAVGGVGYYPVSSFLHIDVGPSRHWFGA